MSGNLFFFFFLEIFFITLMKWKQGRVTLILYTYTYNNMFWKNRCHLIKIKDLSQAHPFSLIVKFVFKAMLLYVWNMSLTFFPFPHCLNLHSPSSKTQNKTKQNKSKVLQWIFTFLGFECIALLFFCKKNN